MCIRDRSREDKLFGEELKNINVMQRADSKLNKIITSVESDVDEFGYKQYFQVFKGSLFKKVEGRERDWRLVIPEG